MSEKPANSKIRLALKILLPILCVAWLFFIFGNSAKTAEQSSEQSSAVVELVQEIAQELAPNSWVATAEGEDYDRLHGIVRKCAHFFEYAALGALFCWCYFAYADTLRFLWIPVAGVLGTPWIDEGLQSCSSGRANAALDCLLDIGGGAFGFAAAWGVVWLCLWIYKNYKRKKEEKICKNKV